MISSTWIRSASLASSVVQAPPSSTRFGRSRISSRVSSPGASVGLGVDVGVDVGVGLGVGLGVAVAVDVGVDVGVGVEVGVRLGVDVGVFIAKAVIVPKTNRLSTIVLIPWLAPQPRIPRHKQTITIPKPIPNPVLRPCLILLTSLLVKSYWLSMPATIAIRSRFLPGGQQLINTKTDFLSLVKSFGNSSPFSKRYFSEIV